MSEASHRKIVNRIKRINRGGSVLESLPQVSVKPQAEQDTWKGYRKDLNALYLEEVSSSYLSDLLKNVGLSGNGTMAGTGFKAKLANIYAKLSKPFSKIIAYDLYRKISRQQHFNSQSALLVQKLLDLNKKSNDIIANKIEQMEEKYDALIGEIVYKYLVNFTRDLVSRMDILYRRLDENFIAHDVELEKLSSLLESLLIERERISSDMRDLNGVLGAQRRAFEEIYKRASDLAGGKKKNAAPSTEKLRDLDYVIFENRFRGSSDLIKERQRKYIDSFKNCKAVLDVACGRGEFLELMKEQGIMAEGVDINEEMTAICSQKGLNVVSGNALDFLNDKNEKYDGIFCSNLIEHLDFQQIKELLRRITKALKENGILIIETVNPESLNVFAAAFYLDLTHIRPIHPLGLEAFLEANGFHNIKILRTTPIEENEKLEEPDLSDNIPVEMKRTLKAVNRNFSKLNSLLFGYQEYAVSAYKIKK
jgi:2-polyprenyl-3-methyl-5-hydroxy-6-metoxy-1,4-benzoquinol methylase